MTRGLSSAVKVEVAKRERRLAAVEAKLRPLARERKELLAQLETLRAIEGTWSEAAAMPAPAQVQSHGERPSPVIDGRMQDVLDCLLEHGELSPQQLTERLAWSTAMLRNPLVRLLEQGRVVAVGSTRQRRYRLAE